MRKTLATLACCLLITTTSVSLAAEKQDNIKKLMDAAEVLLTDTPSEMNLYFGAGLLYAASLKGSPEADYMIFILWDTFGQMKIDPPFKYEQFEKSRISAIDGYKNAIKQYPNFAVGHYRLSILLDPGLGIENQDSRASKKHIDKAAALGHQKAIELLEFINDEGGIK